MDLYAPTIRPAARYAFDVFDAQDFEGFYWALVHMVCLLNHVFFYIGLVKMRKRNQNVERQHLTPIELWE